MEKEYQIDPVAKPRQTQRDRWQKRTCVMKYRDFADKCRALKIYVPEAGAHVTFILSMPASWSKKKKVAMDGQPHQQRKDIDNLIKSLLDALYHDDSCVWDIRATKIWGRIGKIIINEGDLNK